jgi:hypothetical protein
MTGAIDLPDAPIRGEAIIDHETPDKRRFVAVQK